MWVGKGVGAFLLPRRLTDSPDSPAMQRTQLEKLSGAFGELRALEAELAKREHHLKIYGAVDEKGRTLEQVRHCQ